MSFLKEYPLLVMILGEIIIVSTERKMVSDRGGRAVSVDMKG